MPKVVIIIPVYKAQINEYEEISLKQCANVLGKHPIIFVCPRSLDVAAYLSFIPNATIERFEDHYFNSIVGYNQLTLSIDFYKRFEDYQYILIYQLDAYVFRDELEHWCDQNYDYIGAPNPHHQIKNILKEHFQATDAIHSTTIRLYNGGFSLRKISTFINTTQENKDKIDILLANKLLEDVIFGILFSSNKKYNLPNETEAIKFSFECHPQEQYKLNHGKLPMGCHAWYRDDSDLYDNMFWFRHIIPTHYLKLKVLLMYKTIKHIIKKNIIR